MLIFEPLVHMPNGKIHTISEANELSAKWEHGPETEINIRIDYYYASCFHSIACAVRPGPEGRSLIDMLPDYIPEESFPEIRAYLKSHCLLSFLDRQSEEKLRETNTDNCASGDKDYWKAVRKYVDDARTALNQDYSMLETVPIPLKEQFREHENPIYSMELSEEENYNQIDGVLNNTPSQTAGTKKSVLEKLRQMQQLIAENERMERADFPLSNQK